MLCALKLVDSVRKVIDECRNIAKEVFSDIIKTCSGLCDTTKAQRRCERQNNQSNTEDFCRTTIFVPLFDSTFANLDRIFD